VAKLAWWIFGMETAGEYAIDVCGSALYQLENRFKTPAYRPSEFFSKL
jgi:hypothetical protein